MPRCAALRYAMLLAARRGLRQAVADVRRVLLSAGASQCAAALVSEPMRCSMLCEPEAALLCALSGLLCARSGLLCARSGLLCARSGLLCARSGLLCEPEVPPCCAP
ncbi:hypothetical protein ABPG77_006044 [Micractinium sp. CCAP 211/92]